MEIELQKAGFLPATDGTGWVRDHGAIRLTAIPADSYLVMTAVVPIPGSSFSSDHVSVSARGEGVQACIEAVCVELGLVSARLEDTLRTAMAVIRNNINLEVAK